MVTDPCSYPPDGRTLRDQVRDRGAINDLSPLTHGRTVSERVLTAKSGRGKSESKMGELLLYPQMAVSIQKNVSCREP